VYSAISLHNALSVTVFIISPIECSGAVSLFIVNCGICICWCCFLLELWIYKLLMFHNYMCGGALEGCVPFTPMPSELTLEVAVLPVKEWARRKSPGATNKHKLMRMSI